MIVKGIIKTINFSENSCTVRLPLFETAAAQGEVILDAIISIQPGLYNGYTEGDVVFVDFENNKLSQPIVVGKLYLGTEKETATGAPSAMTVSNLKVTTQATLPVDTRLSLEDLGNTVPVEKGISSYHSLADIIKALHQTETSVQQTIKDQSGAVANIIVEYLSQPVDQEAPTAESVGWSTSAPGYQDGFAIWQKTTCYNHRGQALSTEIICLSDIASAVVYKVRCSTRVHAGINQIEAVKISAWIKLGTELETLDTSANIYYCWSNGDASVLTDWIESGTYEVTLEPEHLKAQNLVIQVKHGDVVYEEETIMYAPLNTPVLTLSNDTDVLLYAANGTDCITKDGVRSTATLYVNGDPLEAEYNWTWDGNRCTCDFERDDQGNIVTSKRTIIVTAVNSADIPGVVTCTATVTLDGPFKGKSYSKDFTVTQTKIGTSIISQDTYYALIHNKYSAGSIKTPPTTGDLIVRDKDGNQLNTRNESHLEEWSLTPPEHTPDTNGWKYWTTVKTTYSTSLADFEFSTPIINEDLSGVYSLVQGKTTTYYGTFEPTRNPEPTATQVYKPNLKVDDCWFDTNYREISATELATLNFASKYINYYVGEDSTKTRVTSSNYTTLGIEPKTTKAYTKGALKQCTAIAADGTATWEDIGDEMVTNKLTATYINALDITAKKIKILNDAGNTTLFEADGLSETPKVQIGGYNVVGSTLTTGTTEDKNQITLDGTSNLASTSARLTIGDNFKVLADGTVIAKNLYLEEKTADNTPITAAGQINANTGQITANTAAIEEINTVKLVALEGQIGSINTNKIEVKNAAGNKTIFKADAVTSGLADDARVQIGGFTVGDTLIKSTNEKLQLKSDGTIIAKTGDIGGFTLASTGITSANDDLQLLSTGKLIAKAGDIGGFEINPSGKKEGLYSDYLALNSEQVYFPVQAHLNLNDKVKIYSATPSGGSQTSYIATVNDTDFIIQNQSGAGIKFAKDGTTTNVDVKLTVTLSSPTYKYENKTYTNQWGVTNGSGQNNWLYSIYANYSVSLNQLLPHPVTGKLTLSWSRVMYSPHEPMSGYSGNFDEISFTIPAYTTSVTLSSRVYEYSIQNSGYTIKIAKINGTAVTAGDTATLSIAKYSNTNKSVYSLGHFLPNDSGCSLGSDTKVWSSLHIQAAEQYNSDRRLKNSIQDIPLNVTLLYDKLNPVSYKFNDGTSNRQHFGFIAQDIQQSLADLSIDSKDFAPLCIPKEEDAYMSVRYTEFIALNTDQIQKLKKRVTEQDARIEELERIVKEFKT